MPVDTQKQPRGAPVALLPGVALKPVHLKCDFMIHNRHLPVERPLLDGTGSEPAPQAGKAGLQHLSATLTHYESCQRAPPRCPPSCDVSNAVIQVVSLWSRAGGAAAEQILVCCNTMADVTVQDAVHQLTSARALHHCTATRHLPRLHAA